LFNSGNNNIGFFNSGDGNVGFFNSGNNNWGFGNAGNLNRGVLNVGHTNTGYGNTGNNNSGVLNVGNTNTGGFNPGDTNTGLANTGNSNTGFANSGNVNTGAFIGGNYSNGVFWRGDHQGLLNFTYSIKISEIDYHYAVHIPIDIPITGTVEALNLSKFDISIPFVITSWNRTGGCAGAGIGGGCYYVGGWYAPIDLYSGTIAETIDQTAILDPTALAFAFQSLIDLMGNGTLGPFEFEVIDFHQTPGYFNSTANPSSGFFNSGTGGNSGALNSGSLDSGLANAGSQVSGIFNR
jgi:PPE-repeat protein